MNPTSSPPARERFWSERELASHLASALGEAKAREVVRAKVDALGLPHGRLDHSQALVVLDAIAGEPGIVGITARFVKSRLILTGGG